MAMVYVCNFICHKSPWAFSTRHSTCWLQYYSGTYDENDLLKSQNIKYASTSMTGYQLAK